MTGSRLRVKMTQLIEFENKKIQKKVLICRRFRNFLELIILEFFSFLYNLEIGVTNKSFKISLKFYLLLKYFESL